MHSTIYSFFDIIYDFNSLTLFDLIHLFIDKRGSLDGKKNVELIRSIHGKVYLQIEKKNVHYASQANKGRLCVTFERGYWV